MVYPELTCVGTDIDEDQIEVAKRRAKLYGVQDRCEFHCVAESAPLPLPDKSFDFCQCSSVLEYCLGDVRRFCIDEMVRLVKPQGLLFFSVPNRIYPFEIHTRWGWNYFPKWFYARYRGFQFLGSPETRPFPVSCNCIAFPWCNVPALVKSLCQESTSNARPIS
jgi:ubiquinone/menaquinone biosynthesis C-methylase UbiE